VSNSENITHASPDSYWMSTHTHIALEAPDSARPAPGVLSEDEPSVTIPNLPPPPPNESPIAAAIRTATEADPDLAQPFGQFLRSKNRRINDYETVQMCRFALTFEERWYLQRVMVHVCILFLVTGINLTYGIRAYRQSSAKRTFWKCYDILLAGSRKPNKLLN
jgi:hypothetical protein